MKNASARRSSSGLTVFDWIWLPAGAVLFHVLLFVLFTPAEHDNKVRSSSSPFTIILPDKTSQTNKDPYQLDYYLRYMDPESMIKPDPVNGFSSVLNRERLKLPSPFHCRHTLFDEKAFFSEEKEHLLPGERTLDQMTEYCGKGVAARKQPVRKQIPEVSYPVWSDQAGRVFMGFFLPDAPAQSLFRQYAHKTTGPTMLRIDAEKGKFPFIRILRSCGVAALDQLALRQLSSRKEHYTLPEGVKKKYFFYRVSWKRPTADDISNGGGK